MTENSQSSFLDLSPSLLPSIPDFWPLQWGWWSAAAIAIVVLLAVLLYFRYKKKKLASKKAALALFSLKTHPLTPSSALEVLRQATLSYYPRERVAHLTGDDWYQFLDSQIEQPIFVTNKEKWQQSLYKNTSHEGAAQLVDDCQHWIAEALPPKRGGRE